MIVRKIPAWSILAVLCVPATTLAQPACDFNAWGDYRGTELRRHAPSGSYLFVSDHMAIDADGAPNAYHPDDTGLDYLANAGYPDKAWWPDVLVPDPADRARAYEQPDGPFAGYFVSKTALYDPARDETDPYRYVDARNIPYLVFPGSFYAMEGTGRLGDLGFAVSTVTGEASAFVVADIGPTNAKLGEVSMALADGLGGANVDPRTGAGAPRGTMLYVVFPYSSRRHPWPLGIADIDRIAGELVESVGGVDALRACSPGP